MEKQAYDIGHIFKDFLSLQSKIRHSQRCPKCLTFYQKNGGCNLMTCRICTFEFCYLCQAELKHGKHQVEFLCPFRYFARKLVIICLALMFIHKLAYAHHFLMHCYLILAFNAASIGLLILFLISWVPYLYISGFVETRFLVDLLLKTQNGKRLQQIAIPVYFVLQCAITFYIRSYPVGRRTVFFFRIQLVLTIMMYFFIKFRLGIYYRRFCENFLSIQSI